MYGQVVLQFLQESGDLADDVLHARVAFERGRQRAEKLGNIAGLDVFQGGACRLQAMNGVAECDEGTVRRLRLARLSVKHLL